MIMLAVFLLDSHTHQALAVTLQKNANVIVGILEMGMFV